MSPLLRTFLRLFLPLAGVLLVGVYWYGQGQVERDLERLRSEDRVAVQLGAASLGDTLAAVVRDLDFVATHDALRELLDAPASAAAREHAGKDFANYMASMAIYSQLRWIDEGGRERLRVDLHDYGARQVAEEGLQDKQDRYYFADTMRLARGQLFVSPLDLNVERDEVERPLKPVIRVATPVVDGAGVKRGIVVLNYLGRDLLARFARASERIGNRAMLLNAEGYWLEGPIEADEWGFMFGRSEARLAHREPAAWQLVTGADGGQQLLDNGLWTWRTVRPLESGMVSSSGSGDPVGASENVVNPQDYQWKVVAHLPAGIVAATRLQTWAGLLAPALLLLALAAAGSWKLAAAWRQKAGAEAELRAANLSLRERVAERTRALNSKVDALIEADRRFRTIFETAAVGIARVSPMGRFIEINQTFCDLIGYSREEVLSNAFSFQQITHPEDLDTDLQHVERLLRGEAPRYEMEKRYVRKDGSSVWAHLSVALVRDAKGAPRYFVSSVSDLSERKRLEAELLAMANSDFLTGLANRRHFMEKLGDELARVKRGEGSHSSVLMLDLDLFKRVNDRHGHAVGDELLRHFAVLAGHDLRRIDTVGRIGGEEFAIILPGADEVAACAFAERLRQRVIDSPMSVGDERIELTVSIGVAVLTERDGHEHAALGRADRALYRAKALGRNRVEVTRVADDASGRVETNRLGAAG